MNKSVLRLLFLVVCRLLFCQGSGVETRTLLDVMDHAFAGDAEMEHPIKVNATIASRFPFSVIGSFDNGCTGLQYNFNLLFEYF